MSIHEICQRGDQFLDSVDVKREHSSEGNQQDEYAMEDAVLVRLDFEIWLPCYETEILDVLRVCSIRCQLDPSVPCSSDVSCCLMTEPYHDLYQR